MAIPENKAHVESSTEIQEMDLEWSDLSLILAVCRTGSLSGAARLLAVNHSTIFRRINTIEERTGVRFFERLPNGYAMTDAGAAAKRCAEKMENEVLTLGREILGRDQRLQGKIRVTAPEGIATGLLPDPFSVFCDENPEISISLVATSTALDLTRREADIALRVTSKPPETMLGRRISDFRFCVYASPGYLEKHQARSLEEHNWVLTTAEIEWLVPLIWKNKIEANNRIVMNCSLTATAVEAALCDMGFILLPCFRGDTQPGLVRVTAPIEALSMELWVLTHPDLRYTARVRALMNFLFEALRKKRELLAGVPEAGISKIPSQFPLPFPSIE